MQPREQVRAQQGDGGARMPVPGGLQAQLHARVRLRREVLRKPLRASPCRLPAGEEDRHRPQQGLFP